MDPQVAKQRVGIVFLDKLIRGVCLEAKSYYGEAYNTGMIKTQFVDYGGDNIAIGVHKDEDGRVSFYDYNGLALGLFDLLASVAGEEDALALRARFFSILQGSGFLAAAPCARFDYKLGLRTEGGLVALSEKLHEFIVLLIRVDGLCRAVEAMLECGVLERRKEAAAHA